MVLSSVLYQFIMLYKVVLTFEFADEILKCNCIQMKATEQYFPVMLFTVNSLYCGHPWDRELVSLIARVRNSGNLFQSNVCTLFLPGI